MTLGQINNLLLEHAEENVLRTEREFAVMLDYLEQCTANERTGCKRTYYLPKIFRQKDIDRFKSDMQLLYGIIAKITNQYFADASYRALFNFDKCLEKLIMYQPPGLAMLPLARIDLFFNEDSETYKLCEINADGSSCMNCDRELNIAQKYSSAYHLLSEKFSVHSEELFDSWVSAALEIYKRVRNTNEKPYVAIVDYLECGYVNEFHIFKNHFISAGADCEVCDVRELRYENGMLSGPAGRKIDIVYRRAVTLDVLKFFDESQAMVKAFSDGSVVALGGFHTQIAHSKVLFDVMFRPETRCFLTNEECQYINEHIPFTKVMTHDDFEIVTAEKDKWIIKPVDGYASRGFHAGLDNSQVEWEKLISSIEDNTYVMQEYVMPFRTENYRNSTKTRLYNLTGVFLYDGKYSGIFSRVSPEATCLDVDMLPTVIVDENE